MTKFKVIYYTFIALMCSSFAVSYADIRHDAQVQQFINSMVQDHGFDKNNIENIFQQVNYNPRVLSIMTKPSETSITWPEYRQLFITNEKIARGVAFWDQHEAALERVERQYGVPASVIVGILGVETDYGKIMGNFSVINSLSTLAFQYPRRAQFFQNELANYLIMCRTQKIDPLTMKGSYAGAIGMPQFMPSTYVRYAVDFSGNGSANLHDNPVDVVASVANYLKANGWQTGQVVAASTFVHGKRYDRLANSNANPRNNKNQLQSAGVYVGRYYPTFAKANLLTFDNANNTTQYWLGFENFYVIKRYNPSNFYAMAVYQLGEAIEQQRAKNKVAKKDSSTKG